MASECLTLLEITGIFWNFIMVESLKIYWKFAKSSRYCLTVFDCLSLM